MRQAYIRAIINRNLFMKKNLTLTFNRYAGWFLIAVLVLIPVIRWFQINSFDLSLNSGFAFFSMVGRLAGLVGIVLYAINFILSTRLRFLEDLFGGLNRVYIAHHIVGGIALIVLLAHPLALTFRYVPDQLAQAADFIGPDISSPIDWPLNYGFVAFSGMVFLLILTFFVKLPYKFWLFTHKFLGLAFLFGGLHAMQIPSDTSSDDFMRRYIFVMIALGLIAFTYRTLLSRIFVRRDEYIVKDVKMVANDVVTITMQPIKHLLSYKPGQFVFISFEQDGIDNESHPFSITTAPSEQPDKEHMDLAVTVKALGDFTKTLKDIKPGAKAKVEGAFGRFTNTRYTQPKQIWIAGGIGITPFISMAKKLAHDANKNQKQPFDIFMFYSVKSQSELVNHEVFQQFSDADDLAFSYESFISDEKGSYISAQYVKEQVGELKDSDIFICGPPAMMNSLRKQLIELGVKKKHIHTEEFSIQ